MTTLHALVVDDHEPVREAVRDRLEVMKHTCCLAGSSDEALRLLDQGIQHYDYVVLDLEIPARFGRPPMIHIGLKLIEEIRSKRGSIPIVVITSHAEGKPELGIEVLRLNRANDFVRKPFPDPGMGHTLESAITDVLAACAATPPRATPSSPRPFSGGEVVVYPDRIVLEGVRLVGEKGQTLIRRILDLLCEKDTHGKYIRLTGAELAKQIGLLGITTTETAISGAVRDFRKHVTDVLLREANVHCSNAGVIESGSKGQPGYRLCPSLHVRLVMVPWSPTVHTATAPPSRDDEAQPTPANPVPAVVGPVIPVALRGTLKTRRNKR